MSSRKKDLEIIFNLQWKYGPKLAERSNIVGVYDVPSTTLKWEPFKSYILKNSGIPGDDVKVSYIEDGREFPIDSTLDFQSALYAFRKKAMNGEIINLKLERLSNGSKSASPTCDAQTECSYDCKMERAPEWFVNYMAEFKKDMLAEVASAITSHMALLKPTASYSHYPRKSKTECAKRCRKHHHLDVNEKEVLRTMKMEKKLESKMEKLVNKSKKLKEKKMSLITKSSDSDAGHSSSKSNSEITTVDLSKMGAAPVRFEEPTIPHLMGGEVYRHCWKVINNGSIPWTEDTELHFSWGSSLLEPIERVIACPFLKPGEIGSIEALIHVPKLCGLYQMYWHFHHMGRKFGHWLGCEIIVDKINSTEPLSTSFLRSLSSKKELSAFASKIDSQFKTPFDSLVEDGNTSALMDKIEKEINTPMPMLAEKIKELCLTPEIQGLASRKQSYEGFDKKIEQVVINKSPSKIQIVENHFDNEENNLDTRNNLAGSVRSENDDYINVEDDDSRSESISKIDEETSSNSTLNDMVMVNFPEETEETTKGYAYIEIDGLKTAVPKKFLRPEYLETAEDAPDPNEVNKMFMQMYGDVEPMSQSQDATFINDNKAPSHSSHENEEYDDLPDLVASSSEDEASKPPVDRKTVTKNEPEDSIVPERFSRFEIFAGERPGAITEKKREVKEPMVPKKNIYPYVLNGVEFPPPHQKHRFERVPTTLFNYSMDIYPKIEQGDNYLPRVPNYQQTPPELRANVQEPTKKSGGITNSAKPETVSVTTSNADVESPNEAAESASCVGEPERQRSVPEASVPITSVVSEAMTIASSALKNVVNKIIPSKNEQELGVWVNGHWVPTTENSIRENNLKTLADMGFNNRDLNASLLARYDDDIRRVVSELVQ